MQILTDEAYARVLREASNFPDSDFNFPAYKQVLNIYADCLQFGIHAITVKMVHRCGLVMPQTIQYGDNFPEDVPQNDPKADALLRVILRTMQEKGQAQKGASDPYIPESWSLTPTIHNGDNFPLTLHF